MPASQHFRTSDCKLVLKMLPFISKLASRDADWLDLPQRPDLGAIKGVAPLRCFRMHSGQVGVHGQARLRMRLKALQLRVMGVAAGLPAKYRLGQQGLAPKGSQAFRVEVHGVDGPETHCNGHTLSGG